MSSRSIKTAPYGSWKSPITSDLIVAQSIATLRCAARPRRRLLAGGPAAGAGPQRRRARRRACAPADVTPPPFNARTRVHEYGGGSWLVQDGTVYFSDFADGRLYRPATGESEPQALTPAPPAPGRDWRFADGVIDARRRRWIGVREDHTGEGEPVNAIVAVALASADAGEADPGRVLAGGHDFFSSPRLSPDGNRLAWLAWDHPNMPWNGTLLYLAEFGDDGNLGAPQLIAGGAAELIFQPEWSPDGAKLVFVSDRSGWWNLYCFELASRTDAAAGADGGGIRSSAMAVRDCRPLRSPGAERIVCAYFQAGLGRLALLDIASERLTPFDLPFTEFGSVRAEGDRAVFRAGAPDRPTSIVALDSRSGRHTILKKSTGILDRAGSPIADYLSRVESVEFPTTGGDTAFGLFYPPSNPDYAARRRSGRRSWSSATAGRPRRHRARSTWESSTGPAAASRCST